MTMQQWLTIAGAAAGSMGSIITAFSLNSVIRELNIARQGIEVTVEALASNQRNVPVFQGFDERHERAVRCGTKLVWLGVCLLVAGFVLQAGSVWVGTDTEPDAAPAPNQEASHSRSWRSEYGTYEFDETTQQFVAEALC